MDLNFLAVNILTKKMNEVVEKVIYGSIRDLDGRTVDYELTMLPTVLIKLRKETSCMILATVTIVGLIDQM